MMKCSRSLQSNMLATKLHVAIEHLVANAIEELNFYFISF